MLLRRTESLYPESNKNEIPSQRKKKNNFPSHGWLHSPLQREANPAGTTVSSYRTPRRLSPDGQIAASRVTAEQQTAGDERDSPGSSAGQVAFRESLWPRQGPHTVTQVQYKKLSRIQSVYRSKSLLDPANANK